MSARPERLTFGHGSLGRVPSNTTIVAELAHEPGPVRLTRIETWDWAWGGLLIFSVLLFFRPQDQIAALGAMHLSDLAAAVGLAAMIFLNLSRGASITRMTPELAAVWAVGAVILLTVPTSFWPGGSVAVFTNLFVKVALIFMLMVNAITSPRRIERISWVIVLAFGYVSVLAWRDYALGQNLYDGHRVGGAAGGFFENPNDLALNIAAFLPLAMMYVKRPGPVFKRVLCAAIVVLMLGALVFTKSRSGMIGSVAMLAVFLVVSRSITPATVLAGTVAGMLVIPVVPQSFWERMASITDESKDETGSREARRVLLEQAFLLFLEHPITGVGAGQFQNYAPPGRAEPWRVTHNVVLQIAAEIGVFGLVAFMFLVWRGFSAAWWTRRALSWTHRRRGPPTREGGRAKRAGRTGPVEPEDGLDPHERVFLETHASAVFAGMVGWFVCAQFASVAFNWTFYYMLGLSVCARDIVKARAKAYAKAKALSGEGVVAA
ncbi:MAG: O-antigen ligase family protein [Vicinamibacterales bacterium]